MSTAFADIVALQLKDSLFLSESHALPHILFNRWTEIPSLPSKESLPVPVLCKGAGGWASLQVSTNEVTAPLSDPHI
jgi:hypothetical protein